MAIAPSYVVIHTMDGTIESANSRFQNAAQEASAHYGVGSDGRLVQWVDEKDAAWHAGVGEVNLDSIGIEHEDHGDYNGPRPDALYAASAALVRGICQRYNIPIVHSHVGASGIIAHRETGYATACPDSLDVDRIIRQAAGAAPVQPPQGEDMLTDSLKRTLVRLAAIAGLGHEPSPAQLGMFAGAIKDDGTNVEAIITSMLDSPEGVGWGAHLNAKAAKGEKGDPGPAGKDGAAVVAPGTTITSTVR